MPTIYCDQHPEEKAELYSFKTRAMICSKCFDLAYHSMEGGFGDIIPSEINNVCDQILLRFDDMRKNIDKLSEVFTSFKNKERKLKATEF